MTVILTTVIICISLLLAVSMWTHAWVMLRTEQTKVFAQLQREGIAANRSQMRDVFKLQALSTEEPGGE